jgi:hypothetical protein
MRKLLLATSLAIVLAGCGARAALEPAPNMALPPTPLAENEPPTPDELLGQPPQARPERVDELLTESEEREDDRFDLPPD